jgi:hypothetical protein
MLGAQCGSCSTVQQVTKKMGERNLGVIRQELGLRRLGVCVPVLCAVLTVDVQRREARHDTKHLFPPSGKRRPQAVSPSLSLFLREPD